MGTDRTAARPRPPRTLTDARRRRDRRHRHRQEHAGQRAGRLRPEPRRRHRAADHDQSGGGRVPRCRSLLATGRGDECPRGPQRRRGGRQHRARRLSRPRHAGRGSAAWRRAGDTQPRPAERQQSQPRTPRGGASRLRCAPARVDRAEIPLMGRRPGGGRVCSGPAAALCADPCLAGSGYS